MSGFRNRSLGLHRKWMAAHDRIDTCVSQLPDMLAHVTVGQNTDELSLMYYRKLSKPTDLHLLVRELRTIGRSNGLQVCVINSAIIILGTP